MCLKPRWSHLMPSRLGEVSGGVNLCSRLSNALIRLWAGSAGAEGAAGEAPRLVFSL